MLSKTFPFLFALLLSLPLWAQQQVNYSLSFQNAVHHEAEIKVTFTGISTDTLKVQMSRSSPGRYALHEFAKNVYRVKATDGQGNLLRIWKATPHQWHIVGHKGSATIAYTLFGDHADGTYTGIDETHAHLNMPATLMYAVGFEKAPAIVTFNAPQNSNWKVATQLKHEQGNTYSAPDFQYLMDSPTELSNFDFAEWTIQDKGKPKTIQVTLHHNGTKEQFNDYVHKTKLIVAEQQAVFGELPAFEFGRYTFIGCYMPHAHGDGMEHRNSTIVTSSQPLAKAMNGQLNTVSHEFFHAWNVERLRPKSLEPFNFQEANMSEALWLAEGFTSYYGDLTMARSGVFSQLKYIGDLAGDLNYVMLYPGRQYHSLIEMSQQAPFVDAARSVDPVNRHNTFISYYTYGSMIGLALDLTLRRDYNKTLDDFMQALWRKYGAPEKPYTMADIQATLAEVSGDKAWAETFFKDHIYGSKLPDYKALLASAGITLQKDNPGVPTLGPLVLKYSTDGATIETGTIVNSAAYKAGLDRTDVLTEVNGVKLKKEKDLEKALKNKKPGDTVKITYKRFGQTRTTDLVLDEVPTLETIVTDTTDPETTNFRNAWLGSKSKN